MIKKFKSWPLVLLIAYFSLFYFNFISLVTADLGRHIINGKEILSGATQVLEENYYSYSQTSFPFINHHWLFGVIAYLTKESLGFAGLTLLNIFLYCSSFTLALILAKKKSNVKFAVLAGLVALPLITSRTEVRPESLSLFFFSGYLYCFDLIGDYFDRKKEIEQNKKIIQNKEIVQISGVSRIAQKIFLPLVVTLLLVSQVVWTNSHLFFIFGPIIAGLFLVDAFLKNVFFETENADHKIISAKTKFFFLATFALVGITVINPHGINGSLSPFHIFDNYGYRVAENQSTWFMITIRNQVVKYSYFIIAFILGLASFFGALDHKNKIGKVRKFLLTNFLPLLLLLAFGVTTQLINRVSSFFGIILIPILSQNLFDIYSKHRLKINKLFNNNIFLMISSPVVIGTVILLSVNRLIFPQLSNFGVGLAPQINASADFFKEAELSGPVFNNYDLGGYLIYNLYPEQKVFVDNRPEAYSEDFFENEYIAAQENEESWTIISDKYNFETIYYLRLDQTDWAQGFLYRRVLDPNWIPVYVDPYILIFVKNNEENQEIIKKYELPKEIFNLTELR